MVIKDQHRGALFANLLLALSGVGLALVIAVNLKPALEGWTNALGAILSASLIVLLYRKFPRFSLGELWIVVIATLLAAITSFGAASIWPISGDEYGYLYLADTLLHGRLFNPPPPLAELFDFYWIGSRDGRTVSQYPPGWSVFLAVFRAVHVPQLANPLLVGLLGLLLTNILQDLKVERYIRQSLLGLVLLAPFTLFNGASLFSHLLAANLTLIVCFLQLRDDAAPTFLKKLAIGSVLSVLLTTRHDSFLILGVVFTLDRIVIRKARFLLDSLGYAAGALPLTLLWLVYNWQITGHPLVTTMLWASPGAQTFGIGSLGFLFNNTLKLSGLLFVFAGLMSTLLFIACLSGLLWRWQARFYDLLLPATFIFFMLYPHDAGHQYGPRYWYFAWPTIALTIGRVLSGNEWATRTSWLRANLLRLTSAQIAMFAGFVVAYGVFVRAYAVEREVVYQAQPENLPAVVLIPERKLQIMPWQQQYYIAQSKDFTRNGVDFSGPVLYGRGDLDRFAELACTLQGYTVYRWRARDTLEAVDCARKS